MDITMGAAPPNPEGVRLPAVAGSLKSKAALVTGGSRGLGAALGETLARRGARVVLVARGETELGKTAAAIRQAGGDVHALAFDVGDKEAAHRITGAAAALVGPIDVVVHAASTLGPLPMPFLLDTACEDLSAVLETNVVGPFRIDKIVGGSMALRRTGVIVHVSSDAAVSGYPRWGAYGVSKAAFDQLARVLGAELADHGVRVFSVDPGEMDTKMHADAMPELDAAARAALARPEDVAERIVRMIEHAGDIEPGGRLIASSWGSP